MVAALPVRKAAMVAILAHALTSCGQSEPPSDRAVRLSIITSVLEHQPDIAAQTKAHFEEYPEERSFIEVMLDRRLCIDPQTTGSPDAQSAQQENQSPFAAPDPGRSTDAWKGKAPRYSLSGISLPKHLRWDSPISFCPSGTMFLGNPAIEGDSARVPYVIECGGLCGGGGQYRLRRVQAEWRFLENEVWWVS